MQYLLPFAMLLLSVKWEGKHSPVEKSVGCRFMFKRVIRHEIDGSVSCGGFSVNTDAQVGGVSGYWSKNLLQHNSCGLSGNLECHQQVLCRN
jgi:hypothetical protein